MKNEVWCWDIPSIVREDIEDELAQNLVTKVRVALSLALLCTYKLEI